MAGAILLVTHQHRPRDRRHPGGGRRRMAVAAARGAARRRLARLAGRGGEVAGHGPGAQAQAVSQLGRGCVYHQQLFVKLAVSQVIGRQGGAEGCCDVRLDLRHCVASCIAVMPLMVLSAMLDSAAAACASTAAPLLVSHAQRDWNRSSTHLSVGVTPTLCSTPVLHSHVYYCVGGIARLV